MSITVTVARFQGNQRQEIMQKVQKQMQVRAVQAIQQVLLACLEAEVTAQLGREKESHAEPGAMHEKVTGPVGIVDARMPITSRATGIITGIWKQGTVIFTRCPFRWWSVNAASTM